MRTIGMLASIVGLIFLAFGMVLFVRSIPEIRRYLNIRNM